MPVWLRQSTAVDVALGPFLDSTDGVTAETALTISQADVRLKKNNGAWAQVSDATSATHEENGWYEKELDTTDTNTVGRLLIAVHESGALPVWHEFWVLEEAIYDGLFAASATGVFGDTAGTTTLLSRLGTPSDLGGGATVAANLADIEAQTDDIGAAGAGLTAINLPDQTMNITGDITGNLSGSVGSVTGAVGSVTGAVGSVTGAVGSVTGNVGGNVTGSVGSVAANGISASSLAADAGTEIAAAVLAAAAADPIDANLQQINDVTLTGDGSAVPWGPA